VVVRDQLWIILPNRDILITLEYFKIVQVGDNEWDVIQRDMDENESRKLRLVEMRMRMARSRGAYGGIMPSLFTAHVPRRRMRRRLATGTESV
jgi:hypothetical protein